MDAVLEPQAGWKEQTGCLEPEAKPARGPLLSFIRVEGLIPSARSRVRALGRS